MSKYPQYYSFINPNVWKAPIISEPQVVQEIVHSPHQTQEKAVPSINSNYVQLKIFQLKQKDL